VGATVLEAFSLGHLPDLVERLVRGEPRDDVARAVGAALLQTLPCRRVELVEVGAGTEGVVFSGERECSEPTTEVTVSAGNDLSLRVAFAGAAIATAFQPLLRAAAALIGAAGRSSSAGLDTRPRPADPPRPPDPPTLVAAVRDIYRQAERVAPSRVSVLIRGESGTGKELLARFLHAASDRADRQLVTLNCAALPRDLLESELFGVERGVATGVDARAGKFEAAHGGTLFLDEIGDMAPETQARILRVLAEGEVYRIGGHEARPADVRVISATNRDLTAMLAEGGFRSDLYHRIADWVVEVPPLRERRPDIPNLAGHFLARACAGRGVRAAGISRAAVAALTAYSWPGNVRQLEKEMGRAALFLDDGELLETTLLQPDIREATADGNGGDELREVLERAERSHIERVLADCSGDVSAAAKRLGIGVSTLYRRIKALDID
jgi:DNA-binding NtrC family response regulator